MITLYHETTRAPVTIARLLRDELLVTPYTKPALVGSLWIPEQSRADRTQTLWEILGSSVGADEELGMTPAPGTILKTVRRWPRDTHLVTEDGRPALIWSTGCRGCPDHTKPTRLCGLRGIITYSEEDDDAPC